MGTDPLITLTTDFGLDDPFAGVMKGVILSIVPNAQIIDLTHGIMPHAVREAAFTIGMNYFFFPLRTVHLVIVDPGVGSERRPLLVSAGGHYFIGPDNGIFSCIYEKERASLRVLHITADRYFLRKESPTFQGRDVFAPIAAQVASGLNGADVGREITDYVKIELPKPGIEYNILRGEVIHIDRFGNCMTNIGLADIAALAEGCSGSHPRLFFRGAEIPLTKFYGGAEGRALCAVMNSSGYLEIFVNRGSASSFYDISIGDRVEIK